MKNDLDNYSGKNTQVAGYDQARIIHEAIEAVASGPRFIPAPKSGITVHW